MDENGGGIGNIPDFSSMGKDGKLPTAEELLAALENMPGLDVNTKKELKESIMRGALAREAENIVQETVEKGFGGMQGEMVILIILISLILMVLVFFGYKLYSSLMEKERRREEKKKQKQQKKKK